MQVSVLPTSLDVNSNLMPIHRAKKQLVKAMGSKLGGCNGDFSEHQKPGLV